MPGRRLPSLLVLLALVPALAGAGLPPELELARLEAGTGEPASSPP